MESVFLVFWLFALANIVVVVWALVDAIKVPDESMYRAGNKLIWVLVILFAGFVGAIVYFLVGRPRDGGRAGTDMAWRDQLPPPPPGSLG